MDFTEFIKPEFLILAPVLYVIGIVFKHSSAVKDKYIPFILCAASVILSMMYVVATAQMYAWQDFVLALFTAITQGFLVAGAAVLANQFIKQSKNDE